MKRLDRRTVTLALAGGIAGFTVLPGFGRETKPAQGGIGGTGIVGTVTDFGSVVINGLSVAVDDATAITSALGPLGEADLAIGQSLTVEASGTTDALVARRIHVTHPVIGMVRRARLNPNRLRVAGVRVRLEAGVQGDVEDGAFVAVSGLWDGDRVVASRIEPIQSTGISVIAGALSPDRGTGDPAIGNQRLIVTQGLELPAMGTFATVLGRPSDDGFQVTEIRPGRFVGAAGPLERLSVEGYLDPTGAAPFFEVSGLGHSFDAAASLRPFRNDRTLFEGAYVGTFAVETGIILPENQEARRRLLRDLLGGGAGTSRMPAR
ncbi:MAG: DUF5666 domain-containing protein [Pseudomonadota bacterium]